MNIPQAPGTLLAAERAVNIGARLLLQGRSQVGALIGKGDRDFATAVDIRIEEAMRSALTDAVPEVPFLGEEEGGGSTEDSLIWVLDPIDGTVNFTRDSPLCAISLALLDHGTPILAIVDLPLLGERFVAARGSGAFLNRRRIELIPPADLREAVVGFADFPVGKNVELEDRALMEMIRRLAADALRVRVLGSEAVNLAWLAAGRLDATVMLSNLAWDVSGGVLLAREAGGVVFDSDGSPHTPASRYTLAAAPNLVERLVEIAGTALEVAVQQGEA